MRLFHCGHCEGMKGGVHVALGLLALTAFGYNLIAWALRREAHLAVNVALYGTITALETRKVVHHLEDV